MVATGLGVLEQEVGDGAGIAGQKLAMGTSGESLMGSLDNRFGGESLLGGGGCPADAEQASDGGDFQSAVAVEQEMAEESDGVVVASAVLEEGEGGLEELALVGCDLGVVDVSVGEPVVEGESIRDHGRVSWKVGISRIKRRLRKFPRKSRKTISC
jgi:hypothetical protein